MSAAAGAAAGAATGHSHVLDAIAELCTRFPDGVPPSMIGQHLSLTEEQIMPAAQLELLSDGDGLLFRPASEATKRLAMLDEDDRIVYGIIQKSGTKGIWRQNVQAQSKLESRRLEKILKSLTSRQYIKSVNSVKAAKKKLYILFELTPDESLTGGPWYDDERTFDGHFVDTICKLILQYLTQRYKSGGADPLARIENSLVSLEEVQKYIELTGVCEQELSDKHVQKLIDALRYDGLVEARIDPRTRTEKYKVTNMPAQVAYVQCTPCGVCPVADKCVEGGVISPTTCVYIPKWAEF